MKEITLMMIIGCRFILCRLTNRCLYVLQSFQSFAGKEEVFPDSVRNLISSSYDPVYKFHQGFLKEVEQRLAQWSVSVCSRLEFVTWSRDRRRQTLSRSSVLTSTSVTASETRFNLSPGRVAPTRTLKETISESVTSS